MEEFDILSNIASSKNKQYGAHNTSSSYNVLANKNVGTIADTMVLNVEDSGTLTTIKWSDKHISAGPFPMYYLNGVSFTRKSNKRYCLVQYRYYHSELDVSYTSASTVKKGGIAYGFILISDDTRLNATVFNGKVEPNNPITESTTTDNFRYYNRPFAQVAERDMAKATFNEFIADTHTNDLYTLETQTYFQALNVALIGVKDDLNVFFGDTFYSYAGAYGQSATSYSNIAVRTLLKVDPDIPVYDISDYSNIVKYLVDGEITEPMGEGDYSPYVPDVEAGFKLPDYATTWDIYITAGDDGNGRAVFTAFNEYAEELGSAPRSKVKLIYSVDPKGGNLFESKSIYKEKLYGESFGINLSDLARDLGTDAWLNANNDPKGQHTICAMLFTGGENSIAFKFQFDFANTNTGVAFVPGKTIQFYKSAIAPIGSWVAQTTTETPTAYGSSFTDLYGDVVNLHINETYEGGNDEYTTDTGAPYNPTTDSYGDIDILTHARIGHYRIYRMSEAQMKSVLDDFTHVSPTSIIAGLFGADLWSCLKSIKFIKTPNTINYDPVPFSCGAIPNIGAGSYYTTAASIINQCGSISNITRKYDNFLDYSPYTMFYLHLPFVGYVNLPTDEIYNCTLSFSLAVDNVSGEGMWFIKRDGCIRWTFSCTVGANIPLDGYSFPSTMRTIMGSVGVSGIASVSLDLPNQIVDKSRHIDATSGFNIAHDSMSIFYVLEYPKAQLPSSAPHDVGRPCGLTKTLSSLRGFTKCKNVDVSGYNCTDEERVELISILESGFYL